MAPGAIINAADVRANIKSFSANIERVTAKLSRLNPEAFERGQDASAFLDLILEELITLGLGHLSSLVSGIVAQLARQSAKLAAEFLDALRAATRRGRAAVVEFLDEYPVDTPRLGMSGGGFGRRSRRIPEEADSDFVGPRRPVPREGDPGFIGPPRPGPGTPSPRPRPRRDPFKGWNPQTIVKDALKGTGQIAALIRNPNLRGVDTRALLNMTLEEVRQLLTNKQFKTFMKHLENRNLRHGQ